MVIISFCLSWQADNGGLFFGRVFGKRKFCETISPNKTLEGVLGAIFLATISGLIMHVVSK